MPMRGAKWMREATYLTEDDRKLIMAKVEEAKKAINNYAVGGSYTDPKLVGVRPASYTGEPSPIAAITYGPGGSMLYDFVYRNGE